MITTRSAISEAINRMATESVTLLDNYVDPRDAYLGPDGEMWNSVAGGPAGIVQFQDLPPFRTLQELDGIRARSRWLAKFNGFAINVFENRKSYIIGAAHEYAVAAANDEWADDVLPSIERVQEFIDELLKVNKWSQFRQEETLLRADRDGEVFIRKFRLVTGLTAWRFVEPSRIKPPTQADENQSFGIETDPEDHETVERYWIDGIEAIEVKDMQHRKYNVDSGIKRGIPIMDPVFHNLDRADKILRNMSAAIGIQTAIALLRKHENKTSEAVQTFTGNRKDAEINNGGISGKTWNIFQYKAGTILDVPRNQEYEMPSAGIDPSKSVAALQAELRVVAARMVFPEFMLSAKSDDPNRATALVIESPSHKKFERDQQTQIEHDLELIEDALAYAVQVGILSQQDIDDTTLTVTPPDLITRDPLQMSQARSTDIAAGILSLQTATAESGRDYETEQANIEDHQERFAGGVKAPMATDDEEDADDTNKDDDAEDADTEEQSRLENCGIGDGGFQSGNRCAKGGGGKKVSAKAGGGKKKTETPSVKSARSKKHAVRVAGDVQRYSEEHNEPILAKALRGKSLKDNEPMDVVVTIDGKKHGIELKTMTIGANRKLTMKRDAMARKAAWEKKKDATAHTVVFDDTKVFNAKGKGKHNDSKRRIFYRRGFGSFRVDNMHEVSSMAELKRLMSAKRNQISVEAGGTKKG